MQNFNSFLVVCALVVTACATPSSQAQDTDAQAKARQALREKLGQLDKSSPVPMDTDAQAKAREVLRKEMERLEASGPVTSAPASPQSIEQARQSVRQKLDELANGSPDSPKVAKARAALRQKELAPAQAQTLKSAETAAQAQADAAIKEENAAQAERRAKRNAVLAPGAFQPIESPALPISNDKQQRLAELLKKYRADQVSPEEYHLERAKILAGQ